MREVRHGAAAGLPLHALVRRPEGRRLPLPPCAAAGRPLRNQEQGQRLRHRGGIRAVPPHRRQGLRRLLPTQQRPGADSILRLRRDPCERAQHEPGPGVRAEERGGAGRGGGAGQGHDHVRLRDRADAHRGHRARRGGEARHERHQRRGAPARGGGGARGGRQDAAGEARRGGGRVQVPGRRGRRAPAAGHRGGPAPVRARREVRHGHGPRHAVLRHHQGHRRHVARRHRVHPARSRRGARYGCAGPRRCAPGRGVRSRRRNQVTGRRTVPFLAQLPVYCWFLDMCHACMYSGHLYVFWCLLFEPSLFLLLVPCLVPSKF